MTYDFDRGKELVRELKEEQKRRENSTLYRLEKDILDQMLWIRAGYPQMGSPNKLRGLIEEFLKEVDK